MKKEELEKYVGELSPELQEKAVRDHKNAALLDHMNEHISRAVPNERERFEIVDHFIVENAPRNKLNLMIYDGDMLYVHKNLKNTLCFKRLENGIIFSTKPLDTEYGYHFLWHRS